MKRKISLAGKSVTYLFANFAKQFKNGLQYWSIGEVLNSKQILQMLSYMGFVQEEPTIQDEELSKTITKMLSDSHSYLSVKRVNLFKFLTTLCDIKENKESSFLQEDVPGLPVDGIEQQDPLILLKIGDFDQFGRWGCSESEKDQIKHIFASMRAKRISRGETIFRKREVKQNIQQQTFHPKICPQSVNIVEQKLKKVKPCFNNRVQNRLMLSKNNFNQRIQEQLNKSMDKQLEGCTFKPTINSRSKENLKYRSNSQGHLDSLLKKGQVYKKRKEMLKQLTIKLNQSLQLSNCTFKPATTKHSQSSKWVYVRNRDKQIDRLREGNKQREFMNLVKDRGYPAGVSWSRLLNNKSMSFSKSPILCFDLKMMNEQYSVNVFDGQNVIEISERISRQHKIPEAMWWKVEDIIRKAIQQCPDVGIENNKIMSQK